MGLMDKDNLIVRLSFEFSLHVIAYAEELNQSKRFVMANQLLRSGTGIGASVCEAQNAESLADFIHKMKLAAKEAGESIYWLGLCKMSENFPPCQTLLDECKAIHAILSKIIASSKNKLNNPEKTNKQTN
jgi:four helix bundle protein